MRMHLRLSNDTNTTYFAYICLKQTATGSGRTGLSSRLFGVIHQRLPWIDQQTAEQSSICPFPLPSHLLWACRTPARHIIQRTGGEARGAWFISPAGVLQRPPFFYRAAQITVLSPADCQITYAHSTVGRAEEKQFVPITDVSVEPDSWFLYTRCRRITLSRK